MNLTELTALFRKLRARDPEDRARSQHDEGIAALWTDPEGSEMRPQRR